MKKGKKMPSIELEGHSEAKFMLVDGKIVRIESSISNAGPMHGPGQGPSFDLDRRLGDQ
ncbi:MAG: hypothetical protein WDA16_10775 [Candidatus Thermoplasmatota archaeon]